MVFYKQSSAFQTHPLQVNTPQQAPGAKWQGEGLVQHTQEEHPACIYSPRCSLVELLCISCISNAIVGPIWHSLSKQGPHPQHLFQSCAFDFCLGFSTAEILKSLSDCLQPRVSVCLLLMLPGAPDMGEKKVILKSQSSCASVLVLPDILCFGKKDNLKSRQLLLVLIEAFRFRGKTWS